MTETLHERPLPTEVGLGTGNALRPVTIFLGAGEHFPSSQVPAAPARLVRCARLAPSHVSQIRIFPFNETRAAPTHVSQIRIFPLKTIIFHPPPADEKVRCGLLLRQGLWCLLFVTIRHGLRGGSGPHRLTRALGIETAKPLTLFVEK